MLIINKITYYHHVLEGRRLGTIIGLLKFKVKTILGCLVLQSFVSYNIIEAVLDSKVLKPQTWDTIYLGLKWDELQNVLCQRWVRWAQPLGFAEASWH